ncbi:hypothetical protein EVAR_44945_1 [Eumeta japonica]|uniref:Uncharacterized protein n=1 Tax=Eumeta variegata TaxID=151549 RepID=A0A4C1W6K5_EUMVA|nr:hypothetical protein EVAR_44945_1 [Eumeta japonica]
MKVYPLTTTLDLRLTPEISIFGSPKWGHHHWTIGVASPTRRHPSMRQPINPPSRTCTRKKGVEVPRTNEPAPTHMNAKVHGHDSPIKKCMQLICAADARSIKYNLIGASDAVALQPSHIKIG